MAIVTLCFVKKEDKILMINRNKPPFMGMWNALGGHLEEGETLEECAIRETEEETLRSNHLLFNQEISIITYTTPDGENVENHMYISIDDGPTEKNIPLCDRETFKWIDFEDVSDKLIFHNLKDFWINFKEPIYKLLENNGQIEPSILTDLSICSTCYNKKKNILKMQKYE